MTTPKERAKAIVYALIDAGDNDLAGIIVEHIRAAVEEEREAILQIAVNLGCGTMRAAMNHDAARLIAAADRDAGDAEFADVLLDRQEGTMREEHHAPDDLSAASARILADLDAARETQRELAAALEGEQVARRNAEADNAVLQETMEHALRTILGRRGNAAKIIRDVLSSAHPGAQLLTDLEAAYHALMSYACGNSAPELAEEIAAIIGKRIGKARE